MRFIGNNSIELNEATLIAAVQMYMESMLIEDATFKVTGVNMTSSGYSKTFTVSVQGTETGDSR